MAALVSVTSWIVLVGCSPSDEPTPTVTASVEPTPSPSVTPTPTPTPSPTPDLQQQNIDSAKAAITEYVRLSNEVLNAGGEGWDTKLTPWWGTPEIIESLTRAYQSVTTSQIHTEGSSSIASIVATEYIADPTGAGFEQVRLEFCEDVSAVTQYTAGTPIERTTPSRFITMVKLQHLDGGRWAIIERDPDSERQC